MENTFEEAKASLANRIEPDDGSGGKQRAILLYPDGQLRLTSCPILQDEDASGLIRDLIATAKATKAAGLSAPQIGVGKRVIVVEVNGEGTGEYRALVNPVIHGVEGNWKTLKEGCLSFPKLQEFVSRPEKVYGEALTAQGLKRFFFLDGTAAQAVLHEIEHLDGKLLIDNVSDVRRHHIKTKMLQLNRRLHKIIKLQGKKAQPASSYCFGYQVDTEATETAA